jgi:integral membrane protein
LILTNIIYDSRWQSIHSHDKFFDMSPDVAKTVNKFRIVALLEGWSFLILLFIAMPVKYLLQYPLLVKYTGWVHGALFVAYVLLLISAAIAANWKFKKVAWAFIASLIPFGTFILDKQLSRELKA